jgi:ABC-type multidrug transport system ATPase subunit
MDEVSTGLDSAATFDITNALRSLCTVLNATVVVSLLQPPPETFGLFHEVLLMSRGQIVFHGPAAGAKAYFENKMDRALTRKMDVADFLIETSLDRPEELALAFKETTVGYL